MKRITGVLALSIYANVAFAAGGHGPALLEANVTLDSKTSLQRGARTFVNYCLSCHAAKYMQLQPSGGRSGPQRGTGPREPDVRHR